MVCVPEQASEGEDESRDGMLRWLEWYAQGLQSGMFAVRTDEGSRSISLYPEIEPHCTTAITNGVQVRVCYTMYSFFRDIAAIKPSFCLYGDLGYILIRG